VRILNVLSSEISICKNHYTPKVQLFSIMLVLLGRGD